MEQKLNKKIKPEMKLTAVCGIYCPSCTVYIGTKEDPERKKWLADRMGVPVEEMECFGCRTEKRIAYCDNCKFAPCAASKGIDFCGECDEYPCNDLKEFQKQMPHRIELWEYHEQIKEQGWEKWFENMAERYSCPECDVINSAYDLKCRKCGHFPGSEFANKHKEKVSEYMKLIAGKK